MVTENGYCAQSEARVGLMVWWMGRHASALNSDPVQIPAPPLGSCVALGRLLSV